MSAIRLEVLSGSSAGRSFESDLDAVRIGRAPSSDLVLGDAHVSADHARLMCGVDGFVIEDLGSTNGTWIRRGSERIALDENRPSSNLIPGDVIELGGTAGEGTELAVE